MQFNSMQCNAMQCSAVQCNAMQCNSNQFNSIQFNAIQSTALSLSIVIRFVSCSFPSKVGYFVHHTYIVIHPLLLAIQIQNPIIRKTLLHTNFYSILTAIIIQLQRLRLQLPFHVPTTTTSLQ